MTYGGRVTDPWDRRLMNVYATDLFSDRILYDEKPKLGGEAADPCYTIPDELQPKDLKNIDKSDRGSEPNYYA